MNMAKTTNTLLNVAHKSYLMSRATFGIMTLTEKLHNITTPILPITTDPSFQNVFHPNHFRIVDCGYKLLDAGLKYFQTNSGPLSNTMFYAAPASIFVIATSASLTTYELETTRQQKLAKINNIEKNLANDLCTNMSMEEYFSLLQYFNDSSFTAKTLSWTESISIASTTLIAAYTQIHGKNLVDSMSLLIPTIFISIPAALSRYLYDIYVSNTVLQQDQHALTILDQLTTHGDCQVIGTTQPQEEEL